jgi:carbonic anhydrase
VKAIAVYAVLASALLAAASAQEKTLSADAVITDLRQGNERFVAKQFKRPHQTAERQHQLATGQSPEAAILTCADSRVPPEILFDQGLGDLFDVRVAGNVARDTEIGSLEYAVEHLHCPVVVVMGHQKCGAVSAAAEPGTPPGHLAALIDAIKPAILAAATMPGDKIENAVRINVQNQVKALRASQPILAETSAAGHLKIVGAVYSLDTGKVEWLPDAPAQKTSLK